ncbi:MAG: ATP-binding protein [Verrucomicrobiota bacterium]
MFDSEPELLEKIRLGEDSLLELKEIVFQGTKLKGPSRDKIADELAAFANSLKGGVLVFGIEDASREPHGISLEELDLLETVVRDVCRQSIEPSLTPVIERLTLPDSLGLRKAILKIEVASSLFVHRSPSGYLHRSGSSAVTMPTSYLERLLQQRSQSRLILFDECAVPGTAMADLSARLAGRFVQTLMDEAPAELYRKSSILTLDSLGIERCSVAGVLMATEEPHQLFHSGAAIEAVHYSGKINDAADQLDARRITGPLDAQILEAFRFVRAAVPRRAKKQPAREEIEIFSPKALFEGIVNAVVHRDYSISGAKIRLFVFDDRIEIRSPGSLPNTLTIESLPHRQYTRNETIAGLLNRLTFEMDELDSPIRRGRFMEERGEGVPTIFRESARLGASPPVYTTFDNSEVCLTIFGKN